METGRWRLTKEGLRRPTADQELYLKLRGHAVFELDGGLVDAPAGTRVRHSLAKRTARSASEVTVIALEFTWKGVRRPVAGKCGLRSPRSMMGRH
jgi:hypothetical protein